MQGFMGIYQEQAADRSSSSDDCEAQVSLCEIYTSAHRLALKQTSRSHAILTKCMSALDDQAH